MADSDSTKVSTARRTDELRRDGAKPLGGEPGVPFVHWPNEYAYVEGTVLEFWTGAFGRVCQLRIQDHSAGLTSTSGKGEDQIEVPLNTGMEINLGLSYAGLRVIEDRLAGKTIHIAFQGWGETRDGNRFRRFSVLVLPDDEPAEDETVQGDLSL